MLVKVTLYALTRTGTFFYESRLQFKQVMLMEQLSDLLNMNFEESMGKRELLRIKVSLCLMRGCVYHLSTITDVFLLSESNGYPKVAATRKLRPLRPANSESNGGRYFRNSTVPYVYMQSCSFHTILIRTELTSMQRLMPIHCFLF